MLFKKGDFISDIVSLYKNDISSLFSLSKIEELNLNLTSSYEIIINNRLYTKYSSSSKYSIYIDKSIEEVKKRIYNIGFGQSYSEDLSHYYNVSTYNNYVIMHEGEVYDINHFIDNKTEFVELIEAGYPIEKIELPDNQIFAYGAIYGGESKMDDVLLYKYKEGNFICLDFNMKLYEDDEVEITEGACNGHYLIMYNNNLYSIYDSIENNFIRIPQLVELGYPVRYHYK